MEFSFTTTDETYKYCCEVVDCLVTYCKKSQEEALNMVNAYWHEKLTFDEEDYLLHEYPYYWAMCMEYPGISWEYNPQLWPPPKEYVQQQTVHA